jgi:subtilisin family serine protease
MTIPVVSVGALNPNDTDALFSNVGGWVTAYRPGAAVVSTIPPVFKGGLEPTARWTSHHRLRESLDPDDFSSGFAVWSGTSFSAPIAAGELAEALMGKLAVHGAVESSETAVDIARAAIDECFSTAP